MFTTFVIFFPVVASRLEISLENAPLSAVELYNKLYSLEDDYNFLSKDYYSPKHVGSKQLYFHAVVCAEKKIKKNKKNAFLSLEWIGSMMKSELCLPVAEAIAVTSLTVCTNAVISDTELTSLSPKYQLNAVVSAQLCRTETYKQVRFACPWFSGFLCTIANFAHFVCSVFLPVNYLQMQ